MASSTTFVIVLVISKYIYRYALTDMRFTFVSPKCDVEQESTDCKFINFRIYPTHVYV